MNICVYCGRTDQLQEKEDRVVPICQICTEQQLFLPLNEQVFSYRRESGQITKDRRGEIIRKIAQGRLTTELEIIEGKQILSLAGHRLFRDLFMPTSDVYRYITEQQKEKEALIGNIKKEKQKKKMLAFVIMILSLGGAKYGFDQGWFVSNYDPFVEEINNEKQLLIPVSFQEYLDGIKKDEQFVKKKKAEIEKILRTNQRDELVQLKQHLEQDLLRSPRQGDELLAYVQTCIQLRETKSLALGIWLRWGLELPHQKELGYRLLAMWQFFQADQEGLVRALSGCEEDVFCQALAQFVATDGQAVAENAFAAQLLAEKVLVSENVEQYEKASEQLRKYLPNSSLVWELKTDGALHRKDFTEAQKSVEKVLDRDPAHVLAQLSALRLAVINGADISRNKWVLSQEQNQIASLTMQQAIAERDLLLVRFFIQEKKWKEARELLEKIDSKHIKNECLLLSAAIYLVQQDKQNARKELKDINSSFDDENARLFRALTLVELGDLQGANTILNDLESQGPQKWFLSVVIAIESKNIALLKKGIENLALSDHSSLFIRSWSSTWVLPLDTQKWLKKGLAILGSHPEREKLRGYVSWAMNVSEPSLSSLNVIGNADATSQAILAQHSMKNKNWGKAQEAIQRARTLAPNEGNLVILQQVINAGNGRETIADRELAILASKERSISLAHWFLQGFMMTNNKEQIKEYQRLVWGEFSPRMVSANYPLLWKTK